LMPASTDYVELHCHSAYSFLDGASDPAELAGWVDELLSGVDAVLSGPRRDAVPSAPRDGS